MIGNDCKAVETFIEVMAFAFAAPEDCKITYFGFDLHNFPAGAIQIIADDIGVDKLAKSLKHAIKTCNPNEWCDLRGTKLGYEVDMPLYSM